MNNLYRYFVAKMVFCVCGLTPPDRFAVYQVIDGLYKGLRGQSIRKNTELFDVSVAKYVCRYSVGINTHAKIHVRRCT